MITDPAKDARIQLDLDRDGKADKIDLDGDGIKDVVKIDVLDVDAASLTGADFLF